MKEEEGLKTTFFPDREENHDNLGIHVISTIIIDISLVFHCKNIARLQNVANNRSNLDE